MRSLALLAVLTAGAILAPAAPATAAPATARALHAADPRCPDDAVCFWTEPEFEGERQVVLPVSGSRPCIPTPEAHAESAINNTRFSRLLYLDPGCSNKPVGFIPAGENIPFLDPPIAAWR
ncbi:peptidase inhibitor family I36 protein [Nonomuraea wenchangensis]